MAVIAWAAALLALTRAPMVADLYNLLYPGSRPHKPESTILFLFGFPAMLLAVYVLNRRYPDYFLARRHPIYFGSRGSFIFVWTVAAIMLAVTMYRVARVMELP